MKHLISLAAAVMFAVICTVPAEAFETSYTLTPETVSDWTVISGSGISYMPEQGIYAVSGSVEHEIPVSSAVYICCDMGGFGSYDNGEGSGSNIQYTCYDENGDITVPLPIVVLVPSDGAFHRVQIGTDSKYAGIPENVRSIKLSVSADSNHYIKSLHISSSDTMARDMSAFEWTDAGSSGRIEPNATRATYWIMVGGVFAAALIMFGVRKWIDRIKKGK